MIEKKTINNNISLATKSKKTPGLKKESIEVKQLVHGEYFNLQTMQVHFETNSFIEQETIKLKEWAMLDTSLRLTDFIDERGYSPDIFRGWCAKYPLLELARAFALRRIGARRENGAMSRKFAESTIHRTLGHYDSVWREETAFLQKMKEEKNNGLVSYTVVIPPFESLSTSSTSSKTPEEVAGKIHQATVSNIGSHHY
ncbi:hypothetical protein KBC04_00135 [Candidatus Babeliales bacterium]|nr:hypothetical protein [Candidatus Babeliales bacterium]MBP9843501.1 hypothetical protein [Candidatus Babeliales bacterium]